MWDYIIDNLLLIVILVIAIIICGADLIKAIKIWKDKRQENIDASIRQREEQTELTETLKALKNGLSEVNHKLDEQDDRFNKIESKLSDLTVSDMHDIKSWIVDQYHRFYIEQGWIDAFNAETIDRRYEDYKKEGGNSYIDTLMERIHTLPMDDPQANSRG